METFIRDVRYVTRALLRTPGFFVVTVITLALGVGATTAIYSVINGVLLRPLPYPEPDRIVQLWQVGERGGLGQVSDPNYEDWKAGTSSFFRMAQFTEGGARAVLVRHRFWQQRLGGRPDLNSASLNFEGDVYPVVGVLPATLDFP